MCIESNEIDYSQFDFLNQKQIDIIIIYLEHLRRHDKGNTFNHSYSVMNIAVQLGELLGIAGTNLAHLRLAALLHDIGKISIDEEILLKPNALTNMEWLIMRSHPPVGAMILMCQDFPDDIINGISQHQEKWDGTGYPNNLVGNGIFSYAQIIKIADSYQVMRTTSRPYQKDYRPLSPNEAEDELRKCSGKDFNPAIVNVFSANHYLFLPYILTPLPPVPMPAAAA